ncbi:MAG TPA: 2-oxo-4-hydroxy-4-carboxy-5-ureidoimidazoline decarboxylase [Thermohalobaculum sp.]|nr:2-oxo-4-hydroxy-4-carboxy-5-ureidoimidazoline decarboxylase [Thermohalobaculum sp.]
MTETSKLNRSPSRMTRAEFLAAFGSVYEHSPWIAEAAADAGLGADADTAAGLAACLASVVDGAPPATKLALLRAHPDLAGKLALAGEMTDSSVSEQASAGLDRCSPAELARFQELNDAYVGKFGFPFILAVRGYQRAEILEIFARRLENSPEVEFAEALRQVNRVASLRIRDRFDAGTP